MTFAPLNLIKIREFIFNTRAIFFIVSILFFLIIGTAFWLVYQNSTEMHEQINDDFNKRQSILVHQIASQIDANLRDIKIEIKTLKKLRLKNSIDAFKDQIEAMLERTRYKGVSQVDLVDSVGENHSFIYFKDSLVYKVKTVFNDTILGLDKISLGPLKKDLTNDKEPIVTSTISLNIKDYGLSKEILLIKINISKLIKTVTKTIYPGKSGYVWVIDESGMFLYHPKYEFIGNNAFTVREKRKPNIAYTKINEIMKNRMLKGEEGTGTYISGWPSGIEKEIKKLIAYIPIKSVVLNKNQRWSVAMVTPISDVEGTVKKMYRRNFSVEAVLIAGMFIFVFLIIIIQNHMSRTLSVRVKQAEAEIHETEQIYRRLVAQATDLIYIFDLEMQVVLLNPIAEKTFHHIYSFFHPDDSDTSNVKRRNKTGLFKRKIYELFGPSQEDYIKDQIEITIKRKINHFFEHMVTLNERKIHYSSKLIPIRDEKKKIIQILGISRDETEKLEVDQKIYNTEKLASIGTLAAGVAHELNNPLAVILGFTDLLIERFKEGTQELDDLKIIESSASHAKKIVENLLGFARITEGLEDYVDINQSLNTVITIINITLITKKLKLVMNIDDNLPQAKCDAREFQQIIFNLINNSIAAISEGEGTLTISANKKKKWVCVKISDTGIGIPDALKGRIFDPFFTTKKVGKGTGLGLSLCYGIVKKYGGKITFKSISSEDVKSKSTGTTFTVLLPIYQDDKV